MTLRQLPDDAWHITDMAVIATAVAGVKAAQPYWRASITPTDGGSWQVEFNADSPSRYVRATIGDWLLIDFVGSMGDMAAGLQLQRLSDADAATYYDVGA